MNERIKELAYEAKLDNNFSWTSDRGNVLDYDHQRFAELIINECAKIADEVTSLNEKNSYQYSVAGSIKEHFGVE